MTVIELDPRYTFDNFVVGAGNRLATAAAKRVSDSPGSAYNPLFIYSASGLGKTHLIMAIGHLALRVHGDLNVQYETLEHMLEGVVTAIQAGERDAFRSRLRDADVLLLDDVQFLAGRRGAQEELLRAWDALSARGGQVVLASDRPPTEIDDLDQRLLSRFSGGLIADIGAPEYETRIAIARRKADERGQKLAEGVAQALARVEFSNVRELQGALNRLLAIQELEGRSVTVDEAAKLLGVTVPREDSDEFGSFLTEIADTVDDVVGAASVEQKVAEAILRWEGEGFRTRRLEGALNDGLRADDVEDLLADFARDAERLLEIEAEIRSRDEKAREIGRTDLLRNPDRLDEAEALLAEVVARTRPLPGPPSQPTLDELELPPDLLAVRAARAIAEQPGERYNPFYVHGAPATTSALLIALGNALGTSVDRPLAYLTGVEFAAELLEAIEHNRVDGLRTRYRSARTLILDGVDAIADTERVQEELFHLFDDVIRAGGQLVFGATKPPRMLAGLEDRLRSRLESGLVLDVDVADAPEVVTEAVAALEAAVAASLPGGDADDLPRDSAPDDTVDDFFLSREKVLWRWPYVEDWLETDGN